MGLFSLSSDNAYYRKRTRVSIRMRCEGSIDRNYVLFVEKTCESESKVLICLPSNYRLQGERKTLVPGL